MLLSRACSPLARFAAATALAAVMAPSLLPAQAPAKAPAPDTSGASGFSIETEMLTYRALESNSEAIACDIAAYLYGTTANFNSPGPTSVCTVSVAGTPAAYSVVLLPFDRSVFADFELWRTDMETMSQIERRASCAAKPAAPPQPESGGLTTRGLGDPLLALTPAGPALSAASGVLALLSSEQSSTAVGGTIQDQALMDNVSRELRALNVAVLMPSVYTPYALAALDASRSPYLTALDHLYKTRACLPAGSDLVKEIDAFTATLSGGGAAKPAAPAAGAAAASPAPAGTSHLSAVLSADGLAEQLGADPATGRLPLNTNQHVLLVKALESGGSVDKSTNVLGSKLRYSGGAVGTYALFQINGQLECSGNVYDYGGSLKAKDFQKQLRAYQLDPARQVIFQRGGCRALPRP